jgi:hypothetical protein
MPLTANMREALQHAAKDPLRRVHKPGPGRPPWPASPSTLRALERRGLLEHTVIRNRHAHKVEVWTATEAGRQALEPPQRRQPVDRPRFIARPSRGGGDYTVSPQRALDTAPGMGALEAVDEATLQRYAKQAREKPRISQQQVWQQVRLEIEQRLTDLEAGELTRDALRHLRLLRHQLDRLDRKLAA